ncbi:hypothetical protein AC1031_017429 [Aphanomyces cochlioides]|nr:hypothetical protein AC1031_017429 [Aphanomyces cochlioides]
MRVIASIAALQALCAAAASVTQVHLGLTTTSVDCANGVSVAFASDREASFHVDYGIDGQRNVPTPMAHAYSIGALCCRRLHVAVLTLCEPVSLATVHDVRLLDRQCVFIDVHDTPTRHSLGLSATSPCTRDAFVNFMTPFQGHDTQVFVVVGDFVNGNHAIWDQWYTLLEPSLHVQSPKCWHQWQPRDRRLQERLRCGALPWRANTPITAVAAAQFRTHYSIDIGLVHCVFLDDHVGNTLDALLLVRPNSTGLSAMSAKWTAPRRRTWSFSSTIPSTTHSTTINANGLRLCLNSRQGCMLAWCVLQVHVPQGTSVWPPSQAGAGGRSHIVNNLPGHFVWSRYKDGLLFGATRLIATPSSLQLVWLANDDLTAPRDAVSSHGNTRNVRALASLYNRLGSRVPSRHCLRLRWPSPLRYRTLCVIRSGRRTPLS